MKHSEIRKDYFLDRYVIIAPKRNRRPHKVLKKKEDQLTECYFCNPQVNDSKNQIQIKNYHVTHGKWLIKVIGNLYPALSLDNIKAYGSQEIIVETPDHSKEIHELSLEHIHKIFDVYAERYNKLKDIEGIRHVLVFKNEGGKAGASIPHSHSQVIALPVVPPKLEEEAVAFIKYYEDHGSCPYCDIIKSESGSPRVIWEDKHLFVLAPYASDSPYGAWFIPKRHIATISDLESVEKESFAHALKSMLKRLDDIDVAYNYFFQNSIENENHHLTLKLSPRPNIWAGLELGTGIVINPVPPEDAAKFYQGKLDN